MALKFTSTQAREPPTLAISMLTTNHHRSSQQTGLAGIHPFTKNQARHIVRPLMLGILVTILTIIMIVVCLLMSLVVMMQRPKQEGLGAAFGGSLTDRMLGSGTTDFLQKATVYLGVLFFILALTIATMMAWDRNADRLSRGEDIKNISGDAAEEDVVPATPDGGVPSITIPDADASVPAVDLPPPADIPVPAVEGDAAPAVEGDAAPAETAPAGDAPATDNP